MNLLCEVVARMLCICLQIMPAELAVIVPKEFLPVLCYKWISLIMIKLNANKQKSNIHTCKIKDDTND